MSSFAIVPTANWGLPRVIISDRDRKFVGELWRQILKALNVDLLYSTAWHPQTNGMSERSNQTAEIALRYYIATLDDVRLWPKVLHRMSAALNNSTKYSSTALAPTQVLYGFRTREALDLLRIEDPDAQVPATTIAANPITTRSVTRAQQGPRSTPAVEDFIPAIPTTTPAAEGLRRPAAMSEYRPSHIDAKDAIAFASLRMKEYYDARHMPKFFSVGDMVNLRLHKGYQVPTITSKKIGPQLINPLRILKRIGRLTYRLELLSNMRIHDIIFIAHLEPATNPTENPYHRRRSPPPTIVINNEEEYEMERLIRKKRIRRKRDWSTQYLIR